MTSLRIRPLLTLRMNSPSTFCASPIDGQSTQQAGEISSSLNNLQATFSNQPQVSDLTQKDSNNWLLALGGALLAMALAGGGIFISRRSEPGAKNKQSELSPPVSTTSETASPPVNTELQKNNSSQNPAEDFKLNPNTQLLEATSMEAAKRIPVIHGDNLYSVGYLLFKNFDQDNPGATSRQDDNKRTDIIFPSVSTTNKSGQTITLSPEQVKGLLEKEWNMADRLHWGPITQRPGISDKNKLSAINTSYAILQRLHNDLGVDSSIVHNQVIPEVKRILIPDPSSKQMFQRVFKKEDVFVYASVYHGQPNRVRYPTSQYIGLGRDGFSSFITDFKSDPRTGLTEIREENGQKFLVTESIATNSQGENYLDKGGRNCKMMIAIKVAENFQLEDLKDFPADWRQQIFNHIIEQYEKQFTLNRDEVTFEYPDEFVIK